MIRNSIISTIILVLLIGTIGMPVNVHSCAMKGEQEVAKTCGMCGVKDAAEPDHNSSDVTSSQNEQPGNGCCNDHLELVKTDPATMTKSGIATLAPILLPVMVWSFIADQPIDRPDLQVWNPSKSPPLLQHGQGSYLFHSTFLI